MLIVPAARRRPTTSSSCSGTYPAYTTDPRPVGTPAVSVRSLIAVGTPASGPPSPGARSSARAASSARSGVRTVKAPRAGPRRSARARAASTTSTALTSPRRTAAAVARAPSSWRSLTGPRWCPIAGPGAVSGGGLAQVGQPEGVGVDEPGEQAPVPPARRRGHRAQRPAELGEQLVGLLVV